MFQMLSKWILYHLMGWKKDVRFALPDKAIICLAPHTSNWDFLIGQLYARAERQKSNFLMKREWFFWPFGTVFRKWGGIPVNPDWKKGFYYIALRARLPIFLYAVDYSRKLIQCTKIITPSGDVEHDMREIKLYFKDFKGKHPELFTIGDIKEQ